jgi:hypothetical protein
VEDLEIDTSVLKRIGERITRAGLRASCGRPDDGRASHQIVCRAGMFSADPVINLDGIVAERIDLGRGDADSGRRIEQLIDDCRFRKTEPLREPARKSSSVRTLP